MEKLIVEEICKKLKWYERVVVKIFKPIFLKLYNIIRIDIVNAYLK